MKLGNIDYHDTTVSFDEDHHNGKQDTLIIGHHQELPDDWLSDLKKQKIKTEARDPREELEHVACIPVAFIEKWQREGFDMFKASLKEIVKKLKSENLDAFLVTNRQVY